MTMTRTRTRMMTSTTAIPDDDDDDDYDVVDDDDDDDYDDDDDDDGNDNEVCPGLNHVIVVRFLPSCYTHTHDSASSTHLQGFDGLGTHPYKYPLHQKVLKHFKYN